MTPSWEAHSALHGALPAGGLFRSWLSEEHPSAGGSWQELLQRAEQHHQPSAAPFFTDLQCGGPNSEWARQLANDMPDPADRKLLAGNLEKLCGGQAQVVITGQQPGALGGPLYTLFKIATAIAAADRLTQAGQPTVPLFWSGDDDDDLVEAMATIGWDSRHRRMFRNAGGASAFASRKRGRPCVGELSAATWSRETSRWLQTLVRDDALAHDGVGRLAEDLATIWATACDEDWSWARLNRRFLLRVFQGRGLLIVSGDDPALHQAGADFYEQALSAHSELIAAAKAKGQDLVQTGFSLPVNDRSVHRPLFVRGGTGRYVLENITLPGHTRNLRPGVLLRSPLQDWLFRPAAVVVGPGEWAYLRQLEPLYGILDIPRCPLLPRFFGTVVPEEMPAQELVLRDTVGSGIDPQQLAQRAARISEQEVCRILEEELGVDAERAGQLASGRSRRWEKSLAAMFRGELESQARLAPQREPAWVFPGSGRQERSLSFLTSAAQWGHPFICAVLDCAADHLTRGLLDDWQDYLIRVDESTQSLKPSE